VFNNSFFNGEIYLMPLNFIPIPFKIRENKAKKEGRTKNWASGHKGRPWPDINMTIASDGPSDIRMAFSHLSRDQNFTEFNSSQLFTGGETFNKHPV
jgi:hypothetical protein